MALKFQCKNCGEDIVVRFLKVGEAAECKSCRTSNSVPESAESIDDEAAKSMIKASVSESVKSISDESAENEPIAKALRIIGTISIGLGIIIGMVVLVGVVLPVPSLPAAFGGIVTAFSIMLFYSTLGVLCLGVGRIIELLSK